MGKYSTPVTYQQQKKKSYSPAIQPLQKEFAPLDWSRIDVAAEIERHTSTRLSKKGNTQLVGACPFSDCSVDTDGFMCWPNGSNRSTGKNITHYHCRGCNRSGDLINLLCELNGWDFKRAVIELGLKEQGDMVSGRTSPVEAPATPQDLWNAEQLTQLQNCYPSMLHALVMDRPRQYLESRGFTLADARTYGLGYMPLLEEMKEDARESMNTAYLRGWLGRIVFPLSGVGKGMTFAGRTLRLWVPGMSPSEHKQAIEAHNAEYPNESILRMRKTSPCGYFGHDEMSRQAHITIVEGEFDALSLKVAGLQGVIAMGTSIPAKLIPLRVETVTLALDTDKPGMQAAKRLSNDLCNKGIDVNIVLPDNGKDWNELHVSAGIDQVIHAFQPPADHSATPPALEAAEQEPIVNRHPLVDDRMPEAFKVNTCPRCGRYGEAAFNLAMERWMCICSQLETFDQAQAGKAERGIKPLDLPGLVAVRVWNVKLNRRGLSDLCSQCGMDATKYGHEAIAYCFSCWDKVEVPWLQQYRDLIMPENEIVCVSEQM